MANVELTPFHAGIAKMIPAKWEAVWLYKQTLRGGRVNHEWGLANKAGGIHIHCFRVDYRGAFDREWLGGVETHSATPYDYSDATVPDHEHCWLLGVPCWHDGTSLYFSERIGPMMPDDDAMEDRHHEYVTRELVSWFRHQFVERDDD